MTILGTGELSTGIMLRDPRHIELEILYGGRKDPDKPPTREPGDGAIVVAMFIGAGVGAVTASIVCYFVNLDSIYFGFVGGAIGGGLLGTLIGDAIKKARSRPRARRPDPGPFVSNKER